MVKQFPLLLILLISSSAIAESSDSCDTPCPAGYELKSFADGNSRSCQCLESGTMDGTVPDPAQGQDQTGEDQGQRE
jgi:hypothetical protein